MPDRVTFLLDGRSTEAEEGQTILEAAEAAGIWIPRLCHLPGLTPSGGCRLCTVLVNGRPASACTQPVAEGSLVQTESAELLEFRRTLVEMLFVEGNHFCMVCEKSGHCELQAMAYRLEIAAPTLLYDFPRRGVDASHPDVVIDGNRCIQCGRCLRAAEEWDGKVVFGFVGRAGHRRLAVNAEGRLDATDLEVSDRALDACPVGALLRKRTGYRVPLGRRTYDLAPLGGTAPATNGAPATEGEA